MKKRDGKSMKGQKGQKRPKKPAGQEIGNCKLKIENLQLETPAQQELRPTGRDRGVELDRYFLPYQRAWIDDRSAKRIIVKSRQIGMSLCTAYDVVRKTFLNGNPYDAWVSSRDELQAQLALRAPFAFRNS